MVTCVAVIRISPLPGWRVVLQSEPGVDSEEDWSCYCESIERSQACVKKDSELCSWRPASSAQASRFTVDDMDSHADDSGMWIEKISCRRGAIYVRV